MGLLILKSIFLLLAIMWGFTCFGRLVTRETISRQQIFLMAFGITGFVTIQFLI